MEKELKDKLKCPVCLEIPLGEIYQCKEGHALCSQCYSNVTSCPQCRTPFGNENIRARVVEGLLDSLDLECPNAELGCKEVMKRKDVTGHVKTCAFSQSLVQFCRQIGYYYCAFSVDTRNIPSALAHFKKEHEFITREGSCVEIHLENFSEVAKSPSHDSMWTPVVLKFSEKFVFIVLSILNREDHSVSFVCLYMGDFVAQDALEFQGKFFIKSHSDQAPDLKWKCDPVGYKHVPVVLPHLPFRIPLKLLKNYYTYTSGSNLLVNFSLRRKKSKEGRVVKLESLNLDPTWTFNVPIRRETVPADQVETRSLVFPNRPVDRRDSRAGRTGDGGELRSPGVGPDTHRPSAFFPTTGPFQSVSSMQYERPREPGPAYPPPPPPTPSYTETLVNGVRRVGEVVFFPFAQPTQPPRPPARSTVRLDEARRRGWRNVPPPPQSSRNS